MIINICHLGNGSYPAIHTHFTINNTKHGANKHDLPTDNAGALDPQQTQRQNLNAPLILNSAQLV